MKFEDFQSDPPSIYRRISNVVHGVGACGYFLDQPNLKQSTHSGFTLNSVENTFANICFHEWSLTLPILGEGLSQPPQRFSHDKFC